VSEDPELLVPMGKAAVRREGDALTLVALSAMVPKALKVAERLADEGYNIEVIDPRSLNPFDRPAIIESVKKTGRIVVAEEAYKTLGVGAEIEGDTVVVGGLLVTLLSPGESPALADDSPRVSAPVQARAARAPAPAGAPAARRTLASPRARRLAAEHGIDLGRIAGHGTDGLEGATFTVSNLGAYGIDNGTPVIFVPQAALMFVGAIRDEVLAIDGRVEVRPAMQIAVAYDHRGIDGATASRFTTNVRQLLEDAEFPDVPQAPPEPTLAKREVAVELSSDGLRTTVRHGSIA
jgi:transketolase-like protein/2-oxoacid dehydrogenase/acyltransferase catalytic subunit/2-oxoacid dehydrogenase-like protein with E3 subunit-binding domain